MNEPEQRSPSTHARSIAVEISRFWSPEEALAVFELIDDIGDNILVLHGDHSREALEDRRGHDDPPESGGAGEVADEGRPI
jgi:hypothetical protein